MTGHSSLEPPAPEGRPPISMDVIAARQLGRHAKAALLHLSQAEDLASDGGVDLDYVSANEPGAGPLFRAAREAIEDLDLWAINNAVANGAGRETYDRTERWCHRPGGTLPAAGGQDITPARMRALAGQAEALAASLTEAQQGFRRSGEPVSLTGFRLDNAIGEARSIATALQETIDDLARLAARPQNACSIPWGVCPEHGNTLTGTGGKTWCSRPGCGRTWRYDRLTMPCAEPARWWLADAQGAGARVCDGHALDARARLEGAQVVPLVTADPAGGSAGGGDGNG